MNSASRTDLLRVIADIAAVELRDGRAVPARVVGDAINRVLRANPATRQQTVTRLDVENALRVDRRFSADEGLWRMSARPNALTSETVNVRIGVNPLRDATPITLFPWQSEALDAWRRAGRRGIVQAVTGSGKTRLGMAAIAEHLRSADARVAIIVPTIELLNQWTRELRSRFNVPIGSVGDGAGDSFANNSILVFVARSAADELPRALRVARALTNTLLIADECHRYGSEVFARALTPEFSATLGLSATPERSDDGMSLHVLPRLGAVVYAYDHERGIADDVIADFQMCFVGVPFARAEQSEHDELTEAMARARRLLIATYPFIEDVKPFLDAVKTLASREEDGTAAHYLRLAGERSRLLYGASARNDFVTWLCGIEGVKGQQTILFHETIADCLHLASELTNAGMSTLAHHSELSGEERRRTLARFGRGDVRALVAPRTLDEGIDVPDASVAIIVAGTRVKRQMIQRIGRVLRRCAGKEMALVFKVFVCGGGDDPRRSGADEFTRGLTNRRGSMIAIWPDDQADVEAFANS